MPLEEQAVTVRPGEELPLARLADYLPQHIPGLSGKLTIKQFPGGYSNLTYLVEMGGQSFILRRPPHGTKAATAHDMKREFRVLSALNPVLPVCPRPLHYCGDESIMGAPFYLMERIEGIVPRRGTYDKLGLSPARFGKLCEDHFELLARLHGLDYQAIGLGDFGKPEGYVARQVAGWSKRYRAAKTDDAPDYERVMEWLAANQPPDSQPAGVIHNDFKLDNLVLDPADPTRIIGLLDWEMATIGDPLMDLGSSLGYWVEAADPAPLKAVASLPSHLPGAPGRARAVQIYAAASGRDINDFSFYYCFGLFRLAVIAQQIYYRFYHGQTKDMRFGALIQAVNVLEQTAQKATKGWGF